MATRKPPPAPVHVKLSADQIRRGIARIERVIAEIESFDPSTLMKRWSPEQKALEATIEGALSSVFGQETVEYKRYARATSLDHGGISLARGSFDNSREARQYVAEGKEEAIHILRAAIKWLLEELQESDTIASEQKICAPTQLSDKIFIVHGHDEGASQMLARFVEQIGFSPIILAEQANQGRTVIEKIEDHGDVGFAVVLLTPDDVGGKTTDSLRPRARQNVLLELGYFIARLGRGRVCTLAKGNLEIPTDFAGVLWEALDEGGAWRIALARELKAAGYDVDWNRVMN